MNSKRYDGVDHPVRDVRDLRDLINSSCEMFPDVDAYLYKDKAAGEFRGIKYSQVKRDMDALGTRFCDMGLRNKKIAVIGETSYYWFLTYYATVCGTGVIVPLDKNLPPEEVKTLVDRAQVSAIVYSDKMLKSVEALFDDPGTIEYFIEMGTGMPNQAIKESGKGTGKESDEGSVKDSVSAIKIINLIEEGADLVHQGDRTFIDSEIDPNQMAALLFTSGTTGRAKGVMLSHRNIAANVVNMSRREKLGDDFVVLSILPTHHTFENTCVDWTTFYQGKTLAICEGIKYITKNMNEVHANCMVGVPLVFEKIHKSMIKQAESTGQGERLRNAIELSRRLRLYNNPAVVKRMFKSVHDALGGEMQQFIAGGAAIDPEVILDFEAMGIPMMQGYGMTECAPIIAVNQNNYSIAESVGRPMHGTTVRIDNPDSDGVGEIVCKGPSVMLGYYEDPDATEEVLRDGWLYTGDLGYMDENGFLYVTGRKKTVIVTKGGKNIFPEEIEEVLKQNDLIKEVLVHGVTDKRIGNVVVTADIQPNFALLKERCGEMSGSEVYHFYKDLVDKVNDTMPPYKAIKRVNIREKDFEMTTTGKIKRYGNFIEGEEGAGSMDYRELKAEEKKRAEELISEINTSEDSAYKYRDGVPITDIRDMLRLTAEKNPDNAAVKYRKLYGDDTPAAPSYAAAEMDADDPTNEQTDVSYGKLLAEVNALGTALINRGLRGNTFKIEGMKGGPNYADILCSLSILCGIGDIAVDSYDNEPGYIHFVNRGGIPDAHFVIDGIDVRLIDLLEEGKAQVSQGDRQYLDLELVGSDTAIRIYSMTFSHANIAEAVMAESAMVQVGPGDVVYSLFAPAIMSKIVSGIFLPIYKGATIAVSNGASNMTDDFRAYEPTIIQMSADILGIIHDGIKEYVEESGKQNAVNVTRILNRGAKRLGVNIARLMSQEILSVFGGKLRSIVLTSPEEPEVAKYYRDMGITVQSSYRVMGVAGPVAIGTDSGKKSDSIGKPVPGMGIKVVDKDIDGNGEICLAGGTLAGELELSDGWYHTGDLGHLDDDGYLYKTGKVSDRFVGDGKGRE